MSTPLEKAFSEAGSAAQLARAVGISAAAVSKWNRCPADRVIAVSRATGWAVRPHDLRPDLYPNELDGLPSDFGAELRAANTPHRQVAGQ